MNLRPDPRPDPQFPPRSAAPVAVRQAGATAAQLRRRDRESRTIDVMIRMHCRDRHAGDPLCDDCAALARYAARRLERCVFGAAKPTCANCTVHCYSAQMRERVREVMRYAGPRMLLRHPILGIAHMIDGRRPAPALPRREGKAAASRPSEAEPANADVTSG